MLSFRVIALLPTLIASSSVLSAGSLYVDSYNGGNLLQFSLATGHGLAQFPGRGGASETISRNGRVLASYNGNLTLIDTKTNALINSIPVANAGPSVALSPDGRTAYLAAGAGVSFYDVATGTMTQSVALNDAYQTFLAISPDRGTLYALTGYLSQDLCSISIPNATLTMCVGVPAPAHNMQSVGRALAVSADGSKVFSFVGDASLGLFDSSSLVLLHRMLLADAGTQGLVSIVYSAATNSIYLAVYGFGGPNVIYRIDAASFTVVAQQSLSYQPRDVAVTPNGANVYPVGYATSVPVLDALSLSQISTITAGYAVSAVSGLY